MDWLISGAHTFWLTEVKQFPLCMWMRFVVVVYYCYHPFIWVHQLQVCTYINCMHRFLRPVCPPYLNIISICKYSIRRQGKQQRILLLIINALSKLRCCKRISLVNVIRLRSLLIVCKQILKWVVCRNNKQLKTDKGLNIHVCVYIGNRQSIAGTSVGSQSWNFSFPLLHRITRDRTWRDFD